jgi:hypothetical protein
MICAGCRSRKAGPRSKVHCDYCAGYHAGYQYHAIKMKRAANPEYREDERRKVGKRMRKRRNQLHNSGLNNHGRPFRSDKTKAWSEKLSAAKRGQPFIGGCADV